MGFVPQEVCHIWTLCWKVSGYCCMNSGKSTFTFLDLNVLLCKMAGFVSNLQGSPCFRSFWVMCILGDVIPWVVGFGGWEGRSVQMPELSEF